MRLICKMKMVSGRDTDDYGAKLVELSFVSAACGSHDATSLGNYSSEAPGRWSEGSAGPLSTVITKFAVPHTVHDLGHDGGADNEADLSLINVAS